ncbi:MAG: phosphopantothenoylcysteine decarboxylase [Gammaproteobacteria bacterium RIFCSPLOWO2_02_FULL_61_13]|nr:MAG: phosphopantothenoylcysteine decarboxylase [Gammaproteobacteria bacterium RIFCSPLOWO2_02_FULL_61_13]
MGVLANKRVLLGVTGSIAAYKAADLVRQLREQGATVRVVMTRSAQEFITPLTLEALSGHPVRRELLDTGEESAMGHIDLARWSDVVLVAPASANLLARLAHGLADDLLATLCLAADVPVLVAPAMNRQMWMNPATQANVQTLEQRGIRRLGPALGEQACGETGPGRMLEPRDLVQQLAAQFNGGQLSGLHVMVTAGPTREPIDPVRYISNRSSGRMGYAVARAAAEAGAEVTLITGPVALPLPEQVRGVTVDTALQMRDAVITEIDGTDIFIAAAAVADYRSVDVSSQKIKKTQSRVELTLEKNPDILGEVAARPRPPFTVGFAAETERLREQALDKLINKRLDMIAANDVSAEQAFDREDNALEVYWQGGGVSLPRAGKEKLARRLVALVADRFHAKHPGQAH